MIKIDKANKHKFSNDFFNPDSIFRFSDISKRKGTFSGSKKAPLESPVSQPNLPPPSYYPFFRRLQTMSNDTALRGNPQRIL